MSKHIRGEIYIQQQLLTGHIKIRLKTWYGWKTLAILPDTQSGPELAQSILKLWDDVGYPYYTDTEHLL